MRYLISDELWTALEPLVLQSRRHKGGHPPTVSHRLFFEALLYWARTGIPWRDLPAEFGAWDAIYNRFRRGIASGDMRRLFEAMTDKPQFEEVRRTFIDATIVRTHRHGAGAPRKKKHLGAEASAARQGIGRSRGGLTSKIAVIASDENTALAVDVVPGQTHDATRLKPLLQRTVARLKPAVAVEGPTDAPMTETAGPPADAPTTEVPRPAVEELVGDKAFTGQPQRQASEKWGVKWVSPSKENAKNPIPLDKSADRQRNRIERFFAKLKEFRRVATRHEELKETFLGLIHLVLGFIRLRSVHNVNRA